MKNKVRLLALFIATSVALSGCQVGMSETESDFYKKEPIQNKDRDRVESWI